MESFIIPLLRCPVCTKTALTLRSIRKKSVHIKEGMLICGQCKHRYPIEEYILELLPPRLSYRSKKYATSPQREQQEYFDWYADNPKQRYSHYADSTFWKATDALVFEKWKRTVRPGMRILDVGCAQGRSAFAFADLPVSIVAFDISKAMIVQANARFRRARPRAAMTFLVADATTFPFENETFDVVVLYGVLHHLADPAAAAAEIVRVLKPGGVYFGLENHASPLRLFFDLLQKVFPIWYEKAGAKPLMSRSDFRRWFRRTGLRLDMTTCTFLPPHLVNLLPVSSATRLVGATDAWLSRVPWVAGCAGLLVIKGEKEA